MNILDHNIQAFLFILKAGLWKENIDNLSQYGRLDFNVIGQLAEEQSVIGLVAEGIESLSERPVPKTEALWFACHAMHIEKANLAMNRFIADLFDKLADRGIEALLVKGQGIAQCYNRPLWRSCGDVDLFLDADNYNRAIPYLSSLATKVEEEDSERLHLAMNIRGWVVEIHGTMRPGLWNSIDKTIGCLQSIVFSLNRYRVWDNGGSRIPIPDFDEDVLFVFSHILQHFFKEGVGLRQICDWCRLLWTCRDNIDKVQLYSRLQMMGIVTEWKAFAYLAVNTLGMPKEAVPYYEEKRKWARKSEKILHFILETGNFGHNRDYSYYKKYPFVVFKTISFLRHIKDTMRYALIFPVDSIRVLYGRVTVGIHSLF